MTEGIQQKKRWPWWLRLILYLSPLWIILAIILSVEISGRRAYNRAIQEARDIGGPVTIEEIEAARKVWPDDENGALVLLRVRDRLDAIGKEAAATTLPVLGTLKDELGYRWSDDTIQAVEAFLQQHAAVFAEIDRLRQYDGGRIPFEMKPNPLDTCLPDRAFLRHSAKLVFLRLESRIILGDTSRAVDDIDLLFRHARLLDGEGTLISSLVRLAIGALAENGVQRVLSLCSLSDQQLQQLDEMLAAFERTDCLEIGYRGERAFFLMLTEEANLRRAVATGNNPKFATLPMELPVLHGVFQMDRAAGLRMLNRIVKSNTLQDRLKAMMENEAEKASVPRLYLATRIMIPSLERSVVLDQNRIAQVRAARTGLAIERFRSDHGRFPQRLEELVPQYLPALLIDPFDDKPLRYRVTDDAVIIYSIGEDGIDDGGYVGHRTAPETSPTDWGFVLLKPDFRGRPASTTAPATQEAETAAVSTGPGGVGHARAESRECHPAMQTGESGHTSALHQRHYTGSRETGRREQRQPCDAARFHITSHRSPIAAGGAARWWRRKGLSHDRD
ncbi:MAG TPA: hypothetical protein PLL20_06430 [Phycisphaerae bacterium]|nr:hypothetical protein [Phycisphaerae bacterium]HRR85105.1 hypothetical protein [Phycisphaerae bacterium]